MTMTTTTRIRCLRRWLALLLISALGHTSPWGPVFAGDEPRDGEPDRQVLGALSYRVHCLNCHGSSGTGDGPMAELLKIIPADLTRLAARNDGKYPAELVYQAIDGRQQIASHGSRRMPVWGVGFQNPGRDTDQEEAVRDKILDLVAYLKTLQVGDEDEPDGSHQQATQ